MSAAGDAIHLHLHPQPSAKCSNSTSLSFAQTLAEQKMPPGPSSAKEAVPDKGQQGFWRHRETKPIEADDGRANLSVDMPSDPSPDKAKDDAPQKASPDELPSAALPPADVLIGMSDKLVVTHVKGEDTAASQWADLQVDFERNQHISTAIQAGQGGQTDQMREAKLELPAMKISPSDLLPMNSVKPDASVDLSLSTELMAASRPWLPADKKDSAKPHDPWVGLMSAQSTTYKLTPQAVMPASPVLVAEQLQHWVVHDVQHAQLSLSGMGQEPVEVAIRVQGQMAHVVFGTDNPQARQLLEGSLRELASLLLQDGLVLSGASVGTSSQGQTPSRFATSSFTQRQAASSKPVRELIATDAQLPRQSRSGLDLYV